MLLAEMQLPGTSNMRELPEEVIHRELGPSEQFLWAGQPRQGFVLRAADILFIPFSLLWGGGAIFWEVEVFLQGAQLPPLLLLLFLLFGIPFVVLGLYLMVGRFWFDARQRATMYYGVTSERVIIVYGIRSRRFMSLNIEAIASVTLAERRGGGGVITAWSFPYTWTPSSYSAALWIFGSHYPSAPWFYFELSEGAREMYEIILAAQRARGMRELA